MRVCTGHKSEDREGHGAVSRPGEERQTRPPQPAAATGMQVNHAALSFCLGDRGKEEQHCSATRRADESRARSPGQEPVSRGVLLRSDDGPGGSSTPNPEQGSRKSLHSEQDAQRWASTLMRPFLGTTLPAEEQAWTPDPSTSG